MNIHKSIVGLLAIFWSAMLYGQDCVSFNGPITLKDQIDTVLIFPIYNLDSIDLSSENQGICRVNLHFETEYPRDLGITLVSPSGQEILLTGPVVQNTGDVLPGTSWDISFVPVDSMAVPDLGYLDKWSNDQRWLSDLFFPTVYNGSYYPFSGDLGTLRQGLAVGEWKLIYQDGLALHSSTLHSFSIEFCNPQGIDCSECFAEADTIVPTTIEFCQNVADRSIEFSDYLRDTTYIDNLTGDFTYRAVIVENDTVVDYREVNALLNLDDLPPSNYNVYGMVYNNAYVDDVPPADSSFTIDSLRTMIDSLPRIFCGDLTTESLTVIIEPVDIIQLTTAICSGDSLVVGDSIFRSSVNRQVLLVNQYGCDSIVNVNLTVRDNILTIIDTSLCFGDSILVNALWYSASTNRVDTLTAEAGCDSLILLNLKVRELNAQTINRKICGGDVVSFFGDELSTTGLYRGNGLSVNGCDSSVILNLEVVTQFFVDTTAVVCDGGSFTVGNKIYTNEGIYRDTILSSLGCDSIVDLELIIRDPIQNLLTETICFGDSFPVGENYYKTAGLFEETLLSVAGCDSTVRLNLTVRPFNGSNSIATICSGDSVLSAGKYYNATGIYLDTLPDQDFCDSVVTLGLTVMPPIVNNLSDHICAGDSVVVGDRVYSTTGLWITVLSAVDMCDSLVILDLIVDDPVIGSLDTNICKGDSILFEGNYFKDNGSFDFLIERDGLCDSTLTLNVSIVEPVINELSIRQCEGEPYQVGTSVYTEAGQYIDTLMSRVTGCDSIVQLDLQYNPVYIIPAPETICDGDSLMFDGIWFKENMVYDDTLKTRNGCDSIIQLNLTVLSLDQPVLINELLCFGDSLFFNNQFLKLNGIYRDTLISQKNCDSLVILDLQFREEIRSVLPFTICHGDTLAFENEMFDRPGEYPFTFQSVDGCDSTVILDLIVEECPLEVDVEITDPTCRGFQDGQVQITIDYGNPTYNVNISKSSVLVDSDMITQFENAVLFSNLESGSYVVEIEYTSLTGTQSDTLFSFSLIDQNVISLFGQQIVDPSCAGIGDGMISFGIDGGEAPYASEWDNGGSGVMQMGLTSGNYEVYISDNRGCADTFDFQLMDPLPITFQVESQSPSCNGEADGSIGFVNLSGGSGDYVYSIGVEQSMTSDFNGLVADTYPLTVSDTNGCSADSMVVLNNPALFSLHLGDDRTIDNVGEVPITVMSSTPIASYTWTPTNGLSCIDCSNPTATINRTITYNLSATNEFGCEADDQITIILDIDRSVDPAEAFTPNNDGVNDVFIVHGDSSIEQIRNMEIYNRLGELVFKQEGFPVNDASFGWDGVFKGEQLTTQVLAYFLEVVYTDGKSKVFKGQLTLIR